MVECCKFVSTANFYWSIIYTRDVSGMSFAGNVPMSQNSLKISLLFSQFLAGSSSLFKRMLCTKLRISSPLKFLPLQVLPHCQPLTTQQWFHPFCKQMNDKVSAFKVQCTEPQKSFCKLLGHSHMHAPIKSPILWALHSRQVILPQICGTV